MVSEASVPSGSGTSAPLAKFRPLRTWPALVLVVLMVLARFGPAWLEGGLSNYWMIAIFGPLLCCLLMLIWWLAASRATWKERVFGFLGLIAALAVTLALVHPTMRGPGTTYLTAPMGFILFGLSAAWLARRPPATRTGLSVLLAFVGFGYSMLLRNEGMTGEYKMDTHWRWKRSAEATMLAARRAEPATQTSGNKEIKAGTNVPAAVVTSEALANAEWPGFRGADRAGHWRGPQISTNWSSNPPRQLWKIPVGPGWSSFAVAGKLLFTQEQRGPMEAVVCYDADTGREIWIRQVEARLEDPMGGPGPRATPTIANGGLFVMGATGMFLRLDPATGAIVWQQDLKAIAGRAAPPMWGFSASPLITGSVAIVYGGGPGDKGLLAFDLESGKLRWSAAAGNDSYSSPQLNTIAGEELVLLLSNDGLVCVEPASGKERLNYKWKFQGYRALQPTVIGDTVLLPTPMNPGTRAIRISGNNPATAGLAAEELWTSRNLKPDFTDLVVHQGYVYGIDGGIFTCVDLKTGERKWKGGRYGKGQAVLLENSGLLLVSAEDGRVVLLRADPSEHSEAASFKALEGKTWNHPVVIGDRLYVRNAQEAACYQLTFAKMKAIAGLTTNPH
ncbi:MAG TPA: PQQ-binding-like beta-propeller repeat protein [Candidatus Binatia bacterium]|nr:PQQ-binding-like beta-propeller repeat protein [Candidatus Binatia bacterium]